MIIESLTNLHEICFASLFINSHNEINKVSDAHNYIAVHFNQLTHECQKSVTL